MRGRMLSSVFIMQPLGQVVAQAFALILLSAKYLDKMNESCPTVQAQDGPISNDCRSVVDSFWRIISGVGAGPALLAIIFRFFIYDPGLFDLEVKRQGPRALMHTKWIYKDSTKRISGQNGRPTQAPARYADYNPNEPRQSLSDFWKFLFEQGNAKYLFGTSMCWFWLDFSFYGIGMGMDFVSSGFPTAVIDASLAGNPKTLSDLFAKAAATVQDPNGYTWNTDPFQSNLTIGGVLYE